MKNFILFILLISFAYADESEKQYWDEVKNSSDIELLKSYKEQYPHGVFEKIANIKIKRLLKSNKKEEDDNSNDWIKGTSLYKFYGIGKANSHFKGKHYQENLAKSRAMKKLMKLYKAHSLSQEMISQYNSLIEIKKYTDERGRIYLLLYIDNYNL